MTAAATQPCPPPWWLDCGEISRLLRYLRDDGGLDVADCIAIVEKPWHWDDEYEAMVRDQSGVGTKDRDDEIAGEERANGDGDMLTDCE